MDRLRKALWRIRISALNHELAELTKCPNCGTHLADTHYREWQGGAVRGFCGERCAESYDLGRRF